MIMARPDGEPDRALVQAEQRGLDVDIEIVAALALAAEQEHRRAVLGGLDAGGIGDRHRLAGKATGAVLVRNPHLRLTFTVPGIVRDGDELDFLVTVSNIGEVPAIWGLVKRPPSQGVAR